MSEDKDFDVDFDEYESYYMGDGPIDSPYSLLYCPVKNEVRETTLCKRTCASQSWSTEKACNVRGRCPAWEEYQKIKEEDNG